MSSILRQPKFVRGALSAALFFALLSASAWATEPSPAQIDAVALLTFPSRPQTGLSLAVAHHGRVTYEKGFGFRDAGTPDHYIAKDHNYYGASTERGPAMRAPADGRTIYAIGSVTRQFTAAAILLLAEQHRIALDDAVGRYAPEFRDPALKVRDLLNQRSGLADLNTLTFLERVRPLARHSDGSPDDLRVSREIARLPVHFATGARFEYSSSNYFVLGTIVERIARVSLGTFLESHIFRPLGLKRTAYARAAANDDAAIGYRTDEHSAVWRAYPWDLAWLGGAGAMTSTAEDLARWDAALMAHRVIRAASLAEMWHGLDAGRGQGSYAMGWIEDSLGSRRYLWHNGEVGGFHALNVIFPDDDLAFALLANNQDAKPEYLVPQLAALYFPVNGLDRMLPHSAVVVIEASLALGLGAAAIAIVVIVTFKRYISVGIIAAVTALLIGFFAPTIVGYVLGGFASLVPTAAYLWLLRLMARTARPTR